MPASQTDSRVEQLTRAIIEAESRGLLGETPPDVLSGFSGERLVGALQRFTRLLPRDGQTVYCEVGVFQGMTLLSTAHANPQIPCFGIDNFSQFDTEGRNHALVRERADRLGVTNARIVDADFEDALRRAEQWLNGRAIGVYFVDGPHDYRSQIVCLLQAKRLLAEGAVIVVDDSNYEHVRRANADFLASHDDFALLFEAYTPCHPANMDEAAREVAVRGWWNGVNILVHDPDRTLPRALPPVGSTGLYFQSHDVFRAEFASIAPDALRFCGRLADAPASRACDLATEFRERVLTERSKKAGRYAWQNTDSAGLPSFRLQGR